MTYLYPILLLAIGLLVWKYRVDNEKTKRTMEWIGYFAVIILASYLILQTITAFNLK